MDSAPRLDQERPQPAAIALYLDELNQGEIALLSLIYGHQLNRTHVCDARKSYLARGLNKSERTIQRMLNGYSKDGQKYPGLEERGYVVVRKRKIDTDQVQLTDVGEMVVRMACGKPVVKPAVRVTPVSPLGDTGVTPPTPSDASETQVRGDTGVTPVSPNKENYIFNKGEAGVTLTPEEPSDAPLFDHLQQRPEYFNPFRGIDKEDWKRSPEERWVARFRRYRGFKFVEWQGVTRTIVDVGRQESRLWMDLQRLDGRGGKERVWFSSLELTQTKFWRMAP